MKGVRFTFAGEGVLVSINYDEFIFLARRVLFSLAGVKKEVAGEALEKGADPFFLWTCFVDAYSRFSREVASRN